MKKNFVGYSPDEIKYQMELINQDYGERLKSLEEEYSIALSENQIAKDRVAALEEELKGKREFEQRLGNMLVDAHLKSCDLIYEAVDAAKNMEAGKKRELLSYQNKSVQLKMTIEKFMDDIQGIVNKYKP